MRHAHIARQDAQNILDNHFKDLTGKVTQAIEKAVTEGKFKTVVYFTGFVEQASKDYLTKKLRDNDYKCQFGSTRDESTLEVSW